MRWQFAWFSGRLLASNFLTVSNKAWLFTAIAAAIFCLYSGKSSQSKLLCTVMGENTGNLRRGYIISARQLSKSHHATLPLLWYDKLLTWLNNVRTDILHFLLGAEQAAITAFDTQLGLPIVPLFPVCLLSPVPASLQLASPLVLSHQFSACSDKNPRIYLYSSEQCHR